MNKDDIETRVGRLEQRMLDVEKLHGDLKEMYVDSQKEMREGFAHLEKLIFNSYKLIIKERMERMPKIKPKYTDDIDFFVLEDEK